jgi:hypothetical protein
MKTVSQLIFSIFHLVFWFIVWFFWFIIQFFDFHFFKFSQKILKKSSWLVSSELTKLVWTSFVGFRENQLVSIDIVIHIRNTRNPTLGAFIYLGGVEEDLILHKLVRDLILFIHLNSCSIWNNQTDLEHKVL